MEQNPLLVTVMAHDHDFVIWPLHCIAFIWTYLLRQELQNL
jgi:hypothetical protein